MKRVLQALTMCCALAAVPVASAQSSLVDLQHLLDNAGYNVKGQDGGWGNNTRRALEAFAADYGIAIEVPQSAPDAEALETVLTTARAAIDAAHAAYPTTPLPDDYYVGLATQWYFNIHNWGLNVSALVNRDGRTERVPVKRWFEPIPDDTRLYGDAGVTVMRMQLGMEGALFPDACDIYVEGDFGVLDDCYSKAFADAKRAKWADHWAALENLGENPVVKLYIDAVEYWNDNGFHVMVVPSDFFNGNGSHFDGSDPQGYAGDPLLHAAMVNDTEFQKYFPRFVGMLVAEIRKRGLSNVSVQSLNETRFCRENGRPVSGGLQKWTSIERAVFDEVRRVAPKMSLVSTAVCTAGHQFVSLGGSYSNLATVVPMHDGLVDVAYAIHLYSPTALMIGLAQNARYKEGTLIRYPWQRMPASAAENEEARYSIEDYNRRRAGPEYFEKMFADIAGFAKSRNIRMMFTEINAPKPSAGLPREDRVTLIRDLVTYSKDHDVPLIHFGTLNEWGLSSCEHSLRTPDHRYDPALMNLIAFGNEVSGADPDAPLEPIEVQCGS